MSPDKRTKRFASTFRCATLLFALLALAAPAKAVDVLAPVGTVFSSYKECLEKRKELVDEAADVGGRQVNEAMERTPKWPFVFVTREMKALWKKADELRRQADAIRCMWRPTESNEAKRLADAYQVIDLLRSMAFRDQPKALRTLIKENLKSVQAHGGRIMDELAAIEKSVAGIDPTPPGSPTPLKVVTAPPTPPKLLVPNCSWTGNGDFTPEDIVCEVHGARPSEENWKGYGVTIIDHPLDWEPTCRARGGCRPEPPRWRNDLADWGAVN